MRSPLRLLAVTVSATSLLAACAGMPGADTPDVTAMEVAEAVTPEAAPTATPAAPAMPAAPQTAVANTWAQATSDLPADANVRFGQMPNGMRYAVMKNATPPGQAALRMWFDAGSLYERDDQQGLAHFIEHMVFNGTTNIPEGDLLPLLERLGLAFGPDTNAMTSFDQTIYQLDLPRTNDETVDTALMVMREMAGEAKLAADAIDRERGIVLSEERTRDSPGLRALIARYDFIAKDQLLPKRIPIGKVDVLSNAQRQAFADFYNAYYRPERAVIVAVGDFDVDAMEAKIKAEFSDWTNANPVGPEPDLGTVQPRSAEARIHVEAGTQESIQLAWVSPPDLSPDNSSTRVVSMVRDLALAVLNRRLQSLARGENPPFVAAGASRSTEFESFDNANIFASVQTGQWARGLAAVEQEQRRLVQFGITEAELQREITELRASYETYVAGAATRRTTTLANGIVNSVNEKDVYTSPQTDLALFNQVAGLVNAQAINAFLGEIFKGEGPLVFLTTPNEVEGGGATILKALTDSQAVEVQANVAADAAPWPYTDFGASATVASSEEIADLQATKVVLSNGVQVTVKPTTFRDEQILVAVRTGQGQLSLPTDKVTPLWALGSVFVEGGLGQLTAEQVDETLAANVYGVTISAGEDAYVLSGSTRPADFQLQMQALAAYFTDAGWRPEPFTRIKGQFLQVLPQLRATPGGAFQLDSAGLLYSGDARFALPTPEAIQSGSLDELKAIVTSGLAQGPIEVTIVGDIDVDTAIAGVASTFGTLPARGALPAPLSPSVKFPAPTAEPVLVSHGGRADQGLGFVAWPTLAAIDDMHEERLVRLLSDVLSLRLIEELREGQAVTYSPSVSSTGSWTFPGYGYLSASIQAPPDKMAGFFADVDRIAASLRDTPITADELERARRPRIENLTRSQAGNEYWLNNLQELHSDAQRLEAIRTAIADLERATPADIQRVAQKYLLAERAYRINALPMAGAAAAPQ